MAPMNGPVQRVVVLKARGEDWTNAPIWRGPRLPLDWPAPSVIAKPVRCSDLRSVVYLPPAGQIAYSVLGRVIR